MNRNSPPYRADHVGSFLRPQHLIDARDQSARGELSADALREVEDEAIRQLVRRQEEIGLRGITDGEFRRTFFHVDFLEQLDGVSVKESGFTATFRRDNGTEVGFKPPTMHIDAPIRHGRSIQGQDFEFLAGVTERTPKVCVPSPFLQRAKDASPDAVFVFVPSGVGAVFMKQFTQRGLADVGIKLIATGDVTDDDILDSMGEAALGTITSHHYSAAHESPEKEAFVEAFAEANPGMRPNFMGVGGYDGMHLICAALEQTGGDATGDALVEAMKGLSWESPRGPVSIDPETRDIVQNVYIREVQEVDGHLYNVEFDVIEKVKDPAKATN
jgi:Periplasmic binding protein